jgi:hypothetical protein
MRTLISKAPDAIRDELRGALSVFRGDAEQFAEQIQEQLNELEAMRPVHAQGVPATPHNRIVAVEASDVHELHHDGGRCDSELLLEHLTVRAKL